MELSNPLDVLTFLDVCHIIMPCHASFAASRNHRTPFEMSRCLRHRICEALPHTGTLEYYEGINSHALDG